MPGRGRDGFTRERLAAVLALAPQVVLIEIIRAHRVARLARGEDDARLVPRADVEQLPPRRVFPRLEPLGTVIAHPHHGVAVALDRDRSTVEQPPEDEQRVAERVLEARRVNAIPAAAGLTPLSRERQSRSCEGV